MPTICEQDCQYSIPALKCLITSSNRLESITLYDNYRLPIDESRLQPILSHAAPTLKVLRLMENYRPLSRAFTFDISSFKALRLLQIEPSLLLAPQQNTLDTFTSAEKPDLAGLIRRRLPPNLKVLLLEALTSPWSPIAGMEQIISGKDMKLLRCLLEQRDTLARKLKALFMYYWENMSGAEELKKLYALADRIPVRMAGLYRTDDVNILNLDWLDHDEDNYRQVPKRRMNKQALLASTKRKLLPIKDFERYVSSDIYIYVNARMIYDYSKWLGQIRTQTYMSGYLTSLFDRFEN